MPRIRTIKPAFWTDDRVCAVSFEANLYNIGLWNFSDDEGRQWWEPGRIKKQIFPEREIDIIPLTKELIDVGLISLKITPSGKPFIQVLGFLRHQRISNPSPSQIPDGRSKVIGWPPPMVIEPVVEEIRPEDEPEGPDYQEPPEPTQAVQNGPVASQEPETVQEPIEPVKTPERILIEYFAENRGQSLKNLAVRDRFVQKHYAAGVSLAAMVEADIELGKEAIADIAWYLDNQVKEGKIDGWANLEAICRNYGAWKKEYDKQKEAA